MSANPTTEADEAGLQALEQLLDELSDQRRTMTYLQAAEALQLGPPHRIHRLTGMLERLLERDARAGCPPRAALVVSRIRDGLPAPGFFERAAELGICGAETPEQCQRRWLKNLFGS